MYVALCKKPSYVTRTAKNAEFTKLQNAVFPVLLVRKKVESGNSTTVCIELR